jgi:putative transposase
VNPLPMNSSSILHHRKSIRLKEYDYSSPGDYFITICTYDKQCILGDVVGEEMQLNQIGKTVAHCWEDIANHFENVELDEFIVMPNHLHGIIIITEGRDLIDQIPTTEQNFPLMKNPKQTLGKIIRYFKARAAKLIHDNGHSEFQWQSRYYDRIIRNESELTNIRDYIINNPLKWSSDSSREKVENINFDLNYDISQDKENPREKNQ